VKQLTKRTPTAKLPPASRSAKTNGKRMFVQGSGNSAWARRWRDLQSLYVCDIGDEASLSEFQLGLIDTAATLRCELERMEGQLSMGNVIDMDMYARIAGHYSRIAVKLGIEKRSMKNITPPSVADYIAHIHQRDADAAAKQREEASRREADVVQRVDDAIEQHEEDVTS
jgi:hypothetical protein